VFTVLKRPRWIALTILLLALVTTFIELGVWQLRRLETRRTFNERFEARARLPETDVTTLFPTLPAGPGDASYRHVTARGRFDTSHEIILLSRSFDGISGHHVVTPLIVAPGRALLVDRGWVPEDLHEAPVQPAAPPGGEVQVRGVLFPPQIRGLLGPAQPQGEQRKAFRIEIGLLRAQMPYELYPLYLQLLEQSPPQRGELPKLVTELPSLNEGPHRSYALQWFAFSFIAVLTYVALLRRATQQVGAASSGTIQG
jgi:surfeit locus 1 family protein